MLQVENLEAGYGDMLVLKGISLDVAEGEFVSVIGANGAGKTTLLKSISGTVKPRAGRVSFMGRRIDGLEPHQIVAAGIVQVPEGRLLFPDMTVRENLEMGGYLVSNRAELARRQGSVFDLFPILSEREKQDAGTLSGGEQQMLAIGRALMASPKLIMFDEPSLGLAPKLVQSICDMVVRINKDLGISVLLVEQNVQLSCEISDRAFVVENGEIVLRAPGPEMLQNDHVRRAYLGL
ncbi:MAG: ABC transporter ATP-binding protein [Chloroflexi bacterium]|nr:ABC transporter ATP-binding protein [Chloroflexota bacterium]